MKRDPMQTLRVLYNRTLREPIPEEWTELLAKLK